MARIFMRVLGQANTKSIVLVHGWAMHSGLWRDFAEQLAETYRVVCVDLPGHGQSDALERFDLESVSFALVNAVAEERCCWLGWSLGASIVLNIAQRYPERVNSLIMLAGNPYFHAPIDDTSWLGVDSTVMDLFAEQLQTNSQATLLKFLLLQVLGLPNYKNILPPLKESVFAYPVPDYQTLQQGLAVLKENDLREALANLTIPTRVILGSKDTLIPIGVGQLMQNLLPSLQVHIIEKAGHIPFLSHSQELLSLVNEFVSESGFTGLED